MNSPVRFVRILAAAIPFAGALFAQTSPDEVITLSPFDVRSTSVSRYQAAEATSASRVSTSLFDSTGSINVLTADFVKDVGAGQVIDALKYVSGVTQSSQPVGADRIEVRGFQTDGRVMDGFTTYGTLLHLDPYVIDRIEVVKGPNAVVAPAGTANYAIKKPQFQDFGTLTLSAGQYNADRVSLDYNRKLSDTVAIRLVASGLNAEGYYHDFNHEWILDPGIAVKVGQAGLLSVYAVIDHHLAQNYLGLPMDPAASSTHDGDVFPGIARNANPYDSDDYRHEVRQDYFALYTGKITEDLSVRLAAHAMHNDATFAQFNQSPAKVGGQPVADATANLNPFTGQYDPTTIWFKTGTGPASLGGTGAFTYAAPFSSSPAPTPDGNFNRGSLTSDSPVKEYNFQNDYVYQWKSRSFNATTTAGVAYDHVIYPNVAYPYVKPAFSIYGPYVYAPISNPAAAPSADQVTTYSLLQGYVSENVALFDKKVIIDGSVSHNTYHNKNVNYILQAANAQTNQETFVSGGMVLQPVHAVSLYYGYSENAGFGFPGPDVGSTVSPLQPQKQHEAGVRYRFLNDRATIGATYFFITQGNVQVPNPANLAFPPPIPLLPPLASDRIARGWEYESNLALTKEWSIVANYTKFKNRDAFGNVFRGTAETSGAGFINFTGAAGTLRGFGAGLGVSYTGRRPGDAPRSGYAVGAFANGQKVLNQPTFWEPAYYRADLSLSYQWSKAVTVRFFVENLLDKKYIAGALNRNQVYFGANRNVYGSVTYSF